MRSIIIKHNIEESKISINFDLLDGSLSFPSIDLKIEGDIDLNSLVIKLTELIEENRILQFEYQDPNSLLETNPKIKLVKDTLDEIYSTFNNSFNDTKINDKQIQVDLNSEDDLPF